MDILPKERPLSLRTLCCISVVLHSRDKTLLPKEIKETVKDLENLKRPNLLGYIDSKRFSPTRVSWQSFLHSPEEKWSAQKNRCLGKTSRV